jgi:hypothetical protein
MYKLPKQLRDEIVAYLSTVVVPASVGANFIAITNALSKLEEEATEVKEAKDESK